MADLDDPHNDDLMTAVFADVRQEVAGYIRPAGAAAAAVTVKRRRRNRAIAAGALAVALIAGPVIGLAWANNRPDTAPDTATTPTVSASGSPSAPPSASPSASASPSVLDPGIPGSQLRNMALTIPQWPGTVGQGCASGPLKFTDGKAAASASTSVLVQLSGDPVHVDIDGDARNESVIRVDCALQGIFTQVVAFSRDASGKTSTRGRVVATHVEGSDVQKVWKIEPGGPGGVRVDVGDFSPCCGVPADLPQHQWRVYGWDGQKFRQTSGLTKFPVNPKMTDLAPSAQPLIVVSTDGATWVGSLVATVHNKGPHAANRLDVTLGFPVPVTLAGADAARCAEPTDRSIFFICRFDGLPAGGSRNLRFEVTAYGDPRGQTATVSTRHGTEEEGYPDLNQDDNIASAQIPR